MLAVTANTIWKKAKLVLCHLLQLTSYYSKFFIANKSNLNKENDVSRYFDFHF